jgi:hypothetical protein
MLINSVCPICESNNLYILTDKVRKCKDKIFNIMMCEDCHHMFPCHHFSYKEQSDIISHYLSTKTVTSLNYNIDNLRDDDNDAIIAKVECTHKEIVDMLSGDVLIIGGGSEYQYHLNVNYLEVVDPSKFVKKYITNVDKFNNCMFEDYITDRQFDYVLLQDVVCYFVNPIEIFNKIYNMLKYNGKVVIIGGSVIDEYYIDFDEKLIFQTMLAHYFSKNSMLLSLNMFENKYITNIDDVLGAIGEKIQC